MRVYITDNDSETSFDTVTLTPGELNLPQIHLYILSNSFDEVVVEMTDNVPVGKLKPLMSRVRVVPKLPETISVHTITLLCEIYPDKAAELRFEYMRNPMGIKDKLNAMAEELCCSK